MSQRGGGGSEKGKKKCHVLFEWPLRLTSILKNCFGNEQWDCKKVIWFFPWAILSIFKWSSKDVIKRANFLYWCKSVLGLTEANTLTVWKKNINCETFNVVEICYFIKRLQKNHFS